MCKLSVHKEDVMLRGLKILFWILAVCMCSQTMVYADATVNGSTGLFTVYSADTLYKGNVAFTLYYYNFDREPYDWDLTNFNLSFSYGLTNRLELSVMVPFVRREGDATKYQPHLGSFF